MEFHTLRIALLQMHPTDNLQDNFDKSAQMIAQAVKQGAQLICLPELFTAPYFPQEENTQHFSTAEPISGPTSEFLCTQAQQNQVMIVGGSIFEKTPEGKYYNTTLVIDPTGQICGKYRKTHIPYDPHYYEKFYFSPGDLGFIQVKTDKFTISPLICYDQWYPEPARINTLHGAQLLIYPTSIGWFPQLRKDEPFSAQRWENVMCAHASMNGIYVAAVNRVGKDKDLEFWGGSFIADPFGNIVVKGSATHEEVIIGEISTEKIYDSQEGWGFLKNRRTDLY
ncbi:MAG: nitrilase-related carbon-nitrogen hydrolase [Promethearchaeota archaeon]